MSDKPKEEAAEGAEGEGEGGGKKKLMIIIAAVVVLLIAGGAAAFFLLKGHPEEDPAAAEGAAAGHEAPAAKGHAKEKKGAHGEVGEIFALKDVMVVNLTSEGGSRYCKIGIGLELDDKKLEHEMSKREPLIKDIIITVVSKKTPEELMTAKGQDAVKQEISDAINDTLKDGKITKVYFTSFMIQ